MMLNPIVPPFELNKPIQSEIIAEVIESKQADFKKGDFVSGSLEIAVNDALEKL
jgi:NADPH-dependent curcumin reductase CurA